ARPERLLEPRLARDARVFRVRQNRARHPLGIALRLEDLDAAEGMVLLIGIALVVEVVQQRDRPPVVLVLAELPRVAAHRRFDAEHVLPQALALLLLGDESPCLVSR